MKKQIEQIKEFQRVFGFNVLDTPTIPSVEVQELRNSLIKEEVEDQVEKLGGIRD